MGFGKGAEVIALKKCSNFTGPGDRLLFLFFRDRLLFLFFQGQTTFFLFFRDRLLFSSFSHLIRKLSKVPDFEQKSIDLVEISMI